MQKASMAKESFEVLVKVLKVDAKLLDAFERFWKDETRNRFSIHTPFIPEAYFMKCAGVGCPSEHRKASMPMIGKVNALLDSIEMKALEDTGAFRIMRTQAPLVA